MAVLSSLSASCSAAVDIILNEVTAMLALSRTQGKRWSRYCDCGLDAHPCDHQTTSKFFSLRFQATAQSNLHDVAAAGFLFKGQMRPSTP
ncbi:hypothetical protein PsYK624_042180 [Phanerochaete sordida]|uniref:Uncharacterized protein n=1 Tax=Phanerochaete sordida TaxID=48140 RepID=A0A9P3LAF7_9APHY|nr:hypothetical protein PsYK624_042180 [Phanerochaete sordida]